MYSTSYLGGFECNLTFRHETFGRSTDLPKIDEVPCCTEERNEMSPNVHHLVVWSEAVLEAFYGRGCWRTVSSGETIGKKRDVKRETESRHFDGLCYFRVLTCSLRENVRLFEVRRNFVEFVGSKGPESSFGDVMGRGMTHHLA